MADVAAPERAVLFTCGRNAVRSPMAAAILRRRAGTRRFVASAGVEAGEPDPFVAAAMAEIGIDLAGHHPMTYEALGDGCFDLIVALSPEAHRHALAATGASATRVEFWEIEDPTLAEGSRPVILEAYRQVRDRLDRLIQARFG